MAGKMNGAVATTKGKQGNITKKEAAKRVLAKHGMDTMPTDICKHVMKNFGLDLTTAHASNLKSTLAKETAENSSTSNGTAAKKKPGPKPGSATKPQLQTAAKTSVEVVRRGISAFEVEAVKVLIQQLGADELKRLIDVLAT